MLLIPFHRFNIETGLSQDSVIAELTSVTTKKITFWDVFNNEKLEFYFEGKIDENSFRISRAIRRRDSFLPVIIGQIDGTGTPTCIKVKMRLRFYALIFTVLWLLFAGLIGLGSLYIEITTGTFDAGATIFFIMSILFYSFHIIRFNIEVKRAREILNSVLTDKNQLNNKNNSQDN